MRHGDYRRQYEKVGYVADSMRATSSARTPRDREHSATRGEVTDGTSLDRVLQERARDLSWRLRLPVVINKMAPFSDVALVVAIGPDSTITPVRLLVDGSSKDLLMLDTVAVHGRCLRYNRAILELRRLMKRLASLPDAAPGSPIAYARAELTAIEELIVQRQHTTMRHGTIGLAVLDDEIKLLHSRHAFLEPVVRRAAYIATLRPQSSRSRVLVTR